MHAANMNKMTSSRLSSFTLAQNIQTKTHLSHVCVVRLSKVWFPAISLHGHRGAPTRSIHRFVGRHHLWFPRVRDGRSWGCRHTSVGHPFGHFVSVIARERLSRSNVGHASRRLAVNKLRKHVYSSRNTPSIQMSTLSLSTSHGRLGRLFETPRDELSSHLQTLLASGPCKR